MLLLVTTEYRYNFSHRAAPQLNQKRRPNRRFLFI